MDTHQGEGWSDPGVQSIQLLDEICGCGQSDEAVRKGKCLDLQKLESISQWPILMHLL